MQGGDAERMYAVHRGSIPTVVAPQLRYIDHLGLQRVDYLGLAHSLVLVFKLRQIDLIGQVNEDRICRWIGQVYLVSQRPQETADVTPLETDICR